MALGFLHLHLRTYCVAFAGLVTFTLGCASHAQIIQDGSFEGSGYSNNTNVVQGSTFTVNGWTFGDDGTKPGTAGAVKWSTPGSNGVSTAHHIELDSNHPATDGKVYAQTTMTGLVAGQMYEISFATESAGGSAAALAVYLNGSTTPTATYTPGNGGWVTEPLIFFTATGSSELLRFEDNSSGSADSLSLDAITVASAVPEPCTLAGGALLLAGIARRERKHLRKFLRR